MVETAGADPVGQFRDTMVALIGREGPDLTARQMSILLTVYTARGPHTIRGLAATLNVSKPAVVRAVTRLAAMELLRRRTDPRDRRSVLAQRTPKGEVFVADLRRIMDRVSTSP